MKISSPTSGVSKRVFETPDCCIGRRIPVSLKGRMAWWSSAWALMPPRLAAASGHHLPAPKTFGFNLSVSRFLFYRMELIMRLHSLGHCESEMS